MAISKDQLQTIFTGSPSDRVELLRQLLGYPLKQRDPERSRFWYLRPGEKGEDAEFTCPIAVGFYSELNDLDHSKILQFLTSDDQQKEIYGHYIQRIVPDQPVMYLLLPEGECQGRVAMVLPTEGKLRQRQIQTFEWTEEDLRSRLNRLRQFELARTDRIREGALSVIPLVEWAFYKPIETAKELAQKLADASLRIEQAIPAVYEAERQGGYLHTLLKSFQRELLPSLKLKADNEKDYSFADIYAQTIAYGLFTARVFSYTIDERRRRDEADPALKETDFNREDAWELLPETNPFLRRLFRVVSKAVGEYDRGTASDESPVIADDLIDAISEVVSILRAAKMDAILEDFRAKMNREDIVIRFYEDFLAAYKPQMRERRGVYYTPEQVVSYMVSSVDILLKEKFDKPLGLADPEVMILDPACGTGTFLLWIFQLIYKRFQENPEALIEGLEDRSWSGYVKERLLPRVFGFELLMAPYAIAHLKLGLFLEETGYLFDSGQRLGVYLTNSLEQSLPNKPQLTFEEFIAQEGEAAFKVKQSQPIMVVIGNPPYSVSSANKSEWIAELLKDYKKDLNERKINLDDDYIKFIKLAQNRLDQTGYGVLGFITNNSFISGITHRSMRRSLSDSFNEIFVFDLHGNSLMGEMPPDEELEGNVFNIQQGVGISFGYKTKENVSKKAQVNFVELYGGKKKKLDFLSQNNISTTKWKKIYPEQSKYLFFCDKDFSLKNEYENFISLTEVFKEFRSGIQTKRDKFVYSFSLNDLHRSMEDLVNLDIEVIRQKYDLPIDGRDWSVQKAKQDIQVNNAKEITVVYHPFDKRWCFYTGKTKGIMAYPRHELMKHMLKPNLALLTVRNSRHQNINNFFIADCPVDKDSVSSYDNVTCFPLYKYLDNSGSDLQYDLFDSSQQINISEKILDEVFLRLKYVPDPKLIIYYIYSIFYSFTYRARYSEYLKIDYPRVPLTSNRELFIRLAAYGEELASLHLMKSSKLDHPFTQFIETGGDRKVDPGHPKYVGGSVVINKKGDKFAGVPEAVWNFYVGGYQVCQKWLKDRKGRTLSEDDILHYQRIVVALKETMDLMQKIDEAIPGWPIE